MQPLMMMTTYLENKPGSCLNSSIFFSQSETHANQLHKKKIIRSNRLPFQEKVKILPILLIYFYVFQRRKYLLFALHNNICSIYVDKYHELVTQ